MANKHTNCSSKTANVNVIMVSKFWHWLKEIDARRYPEDVKILSTKNTVEIYQYLAQQLKHLPSKSLDDIRETLIFKKSCYFNWW